MPVPYISSFISNLLLTIGFDVGTASSYLNKHIYTQSTEAVTLIKSGGGSWKYWGYWATQYPQQ